MNNSEIWETKALSDLTAKLEENFSRGQGHNIFAALWKLMLLVPQFHEHKLY